MTVSNAFNRPDQLSASLRTRILETAARLGYAGPDPVGRALRRGSSEVVGVVLADELPDAFSDPGSTAFLLGVTTAAAAAGVSVQLISAAGDDVERRVQTAAVDGLIVLGGRGNDAAVSVAQRRRLPVVVAGSRARGLPTVTVDNRAAAARTAEHVQALGHERVAVIAHLRRGGTLERVPESALRTAHFGPHAERARGYRSVFGNAVLWRAGGNRVDAGREAARAALADGPTALLAATDVLAIGALQALAELGLRAGRDVAVSGFDDIGEAARCTPPLTTVHQDLTAQGADAYRCLAGDSTPARHPTRLVIRTSTTGEPS